MNRSAWTNTPRPANDDAEAERLKKARQLREATQTMIWYFRMVFEKAGLEFTGDNETEILTMCKNLRGDNATF